MRLTVSAYVYVVREEGRSVYVCQPLSGPLVATRDVLLSTALSRLGNKMRKIVNDWIKEGKVNRIRSWYYDSDIKSRTEKLTLVLRDRTLRWKLLLVTLPAFNRYIAFSPSIPDIVFELDSLRNLESRATDIYSSWAQGVVSRDGDELKGIGESGDMWVEPLEVDVETTVRLKKKEKNILAALFGGEKMSGSDELHKVGQCLDEIADDIEPALGRDELVDEVDAMLGRKDRQGVLLVGPTAVGKSAIIRQCAKRRTERFSDRRGHKPQTWLLSPQRLISGMSYLGQWEQRWLAILREATRRDHILYFDDLVGLFSAGRTRDSSLSAADVLRGYLSENRVRIVAESTAEQLAILRRRDRALADRFHLVHVPSLSSADALPVVLESTYNVETRSERFFHPETVPLVMRHQEIFSPDRAFPGKAIEMTKTLADHTSQSVDGGSFYRLAATQVGANMMLLLGNLGDQKAIQASLGYQLIGQPDAINALSRVVIRFAQNLQPPDRPLGVLLFLGPTGVGKTESAKALTRLLYKEDAHLVRLDMNEMTTPFAAEQLVGTFDQPEGRLTAAVRRRPNCVILLDEIEKAHPDVFDYLLQVIGEGRLTDARGRVADFRSSIIIMTSNLGASEQSTSMGFDVTAERRTQIYKKAAQSFFRPEFFNRIDDVVAFRSLDSKDMEQIVRIQMDDVLSRDGLRRRDVYVHVAESAIRRVIKTGFDSRLGARSVRRMLEREVIGPLGDCLSDLAVDDPALVHIADAESSGRLACEVTQLKVATQSAIHRISDLEKLVDVGGQLHQSLDSQLGEIADELRSEDERLGVKNHNASYYALREHVYRCLELLKAAKAKLSRRGEPKLHATSAPSSVPRRYVEGAGSKRILRDRLAQEDLRSAISGDDQGSSLEATSEESLAREIVDSFAVASAMVQYALSPRVWAIGFHDVTSGSQAGQHGNESNEQGDDYEIYGRPGGSAEFLSRLNYCLRAGWQYEVASRVLPNGFVKVSGVSLLGVLKPLLGTYRTEIETKPSHLSVLRAMAVPEGATEDEIDRIVLFADTWSDHAGHLTKSAEQELPAELIRGVIGSRVVDFVSGASVELSVDDWFRSDSVIARNLAWWTECLPIPNQLTES